MPANAETQEKQVPSLCWDDPMEEGMETHSSILAWRIPMGQGAWHAAVHGVTKSQTPDTDKAQQWEFGDSEMALVVKNLPVKAGDIRDAGSIPAFRRFPWRREWLPPPVFLPGESHGQRSLAGYSPWGRKQIRLKLLRTHARGINLPICGNQSFTVFTIEVSLHKAKRESTVKSIHFLKQPRRSLYLKTLKCKMCTPKGALQDWFLYKNK